MKDVQVTVTLRVTATNLFNFILVKIVSDVTIVIVFADIATGLGLLGRQLCVKSLHGLKKY